MNHAIRTVTLLALALASAAHAATLTISGSSGAASTVLDRAALIDAGGAAEQWTVLEPHENALRRYVGVPIVPVLDAAFGSRWRNADSVAFDCADGYRALISPSRLLDHRALLAWARADGSPFALRNRLQNDETVSLAPFYLVWDNIGSDALQAAGASGWPYQIVGLALVDSSTELQRTLPPTGAGAAVERGHVAFRTHCISCHAINGQGGDKAPELNHPVSVTEYLGPGWLQRWMLEPTAIRYNTTMPGLPPGLPGREQIAADIEQYLRAMAGVEWRRTEAR